MGLVIRSTNWGFGWLTLWHFHAQGSPNSFGRCSTARASGARQDHFGPGEPILIPPQSSQVEHEAELAVVLGQRGRWLTPEEAGEAILGYTVANDVTARDLQRRDGQWTRGKGFDTFCPLGPWIETDLNPADALITCWVNGQIRQMASTRDMVFPVRQLIAFASSVMMLEPGDIILTGTPAGVGPLESGDVLTAEIEGIGELSNPVKLDPYGVENT